MGACHKGLKQSIHKKRLNVLYYINRCESIRMKDVQGLIVSYKQEKAVVDMVGWIVALISGALMSIQGVLNTEVTKQTSLWVSTGWVQLSALIVCIAAWLIRDRSSVTALMDVSPKYMLLGGVIGAFITLTVIVSMNRLGPARAVQLIVVSQIAVAYLIELFGLFGVEKTEFQWSKVLGLGLSIIGIIIVKWK